MALRAAVTPRASVGQSAMMTGAQTCVKMLNPSVNQTPLPYGMTKMGLNPAEKRKRGTRRGVGKAEARKEADRVGGVKDGKQQGSCLRAAYLFRKCADIMKLLVLFTTDVCITL